MTAPSGADICEKLVGSAPQAVGGNVIEQIFREYTLPVCRVVAPGPPLAKQRRIVACFQQLCALCNQLHERQTIAHHTQAHLAQALVEKVET